MYLIVLSSNNIIIVCVVNLPQRRTCTSDCIAKYQVYELTTSAGHFPVLGTVAIGLVCSYNITIVSNYNYPASETTSSDPELVIAIILFPWEMFSMSNNVCLLKIEFSPTHGHWVTISNKLTIIILFNLLLYCTAKCHLDCNASL